VTGITDPFEPRIWKLAHDRSLVLGPRARIMAILNVTPDSFSDGGLFDGRVEPAIDAGMRRADEGADILDIGGESTRPGAQPVDAEEEIRRVLPVIEALAARTSCLLSVDTYRAGTARLALEAGAHIVNDVWGAQRDPDMAGVASKAGAGLCLMHTGRERDTLPDVVADQFHFLERSIAIARAAGVEDARLVLDPGFGFAKSTSQNFELMMRTAELHVLGFPLLVGTSRKRFVRGALPRGVEGQDRATAATGVLLRERGAAIVRVHDVAASRDALALVDAALGRPWVEPA